MIAAMIGVYVLAGVICAVVVDGLEGGWRLWGKPWWDGWGFLKRAVGLAVIWPALILLLLIHWGLE